MRSFLDYLIYMCAFCVIGVGALGAWEAVSEQPRALISPGGEGDPRAVIPSPNIGKMTILLMGADERPQFGDKGRSDTMILLFVSQRTKKAALLSKSPHRTKKSLPMLSDFQPEKRDDDKNASP